MRPPTPALRFAGLAFVAACWALAPGLTRADIAVVVHPDCPVQSLSQKEVSDLYLGRSRAVAGGEKLWVLDQMGDSPLRERFYLQLNGMDLRRVNAYWARLQFSGDTQPPKPLADSRQVINTVAGNRLSIGYIDATQVTDRVRVVLRLPE
jgi:ABC-type phosphate transport system substrate-binding protein